MTRDEFRELVLREGRRRFPSGYPQGIIDRVDMEIPIIENADSIDYIAIVWDFINFCEDVDRVKALCDKYGMEYPKNGKIPISHWGRGSDGGSMCCYLLGITNFDPIKNGLFFERFMNPEKISTTDIDTDCSTRERQLLLLYLKDKYGYISQIGTFGTLGVKSALKDILKAFNVPFKIANDLTKSLPDCSIEELEEDEDFMSKFHSLPFDGADSDFVWSAVKRINGLTKSVGIHASGVIPCGKPISDTMPCRYDKEKGYVTEWDMKQSEQMKFIKLDMLGLKTLDVLDDLESEFGITPYNIDFNDEKTFELLRNGDTVGVFQMGSKGFIEIMKNLNPTEFKDLATMVALYRPAMLDSFIDGKSLANCLCDRKNGRDATVYLFPEEEEYLNSTYGLTLYQEQIMQRVRQMTGCSFGKADKVRKAVGKKDLVLLEEQIEWLRTESMKHRFTSSVAWDDVEWRMKVIEQVCTDIKASGRYCFNKSHAYAYGGVSYETAYYKAHHLPQFYVATLNSLKNHPDDMSMIIKDAESHGIKIVAPQINESIDEWKVIDDNTISFGFSYVKGVNKASEFIINERENNGKFKSIEEFALRLPTKLVNKTAIKNLAMAGAFDEIYHNRCELVNSIDNLCKMRTNRQKTMKRKSGDYTPTVEENLELLRKGDKKIKYEIVDSVEDSTVKAFWEFEVLQYFISCTPLDEYKDEIARYTPTNSPIEQLDGEFYWCGVVDNIHEITTKKGQKMAFVTVFNESHAIEFTMFPDLYKDSSEHIVKGNIVVVKGNASEYNGKVTANAQYIRTIINSGVRQVQEIHYTPNDENDVFGWLDIKDNTVYGGMTVLYLNVGNCVLRAKECVVVNDNLLKTMSMYGTVTYH